MPAAPRTRGRRESLIEFSLPLDSGLIQSVIIIRLKGSPAPSISTDCLTSLLSFLNLLKSLSEETVEIK